jgi:hypothetical protein
MVKYYYIPKKYEIQLYEKISDWAKKEDSFIVLIGIYKKNGILDESDNICFNKTILNQIIHIVNGYEIDSEIYKLIGFCLEADLEVIAPDFQELINNFIDILQFETANEFLTWQKTLQND